MKLIKSSKSFAGHTEFYAHESSATATEMKFALFRPKEDKKPGAILYWLSGLTCTEENFMQKAGAQQYLSENNLWLVAPDTSPRGINIPGQSDNFYFGLGAGYYVDAEKAPWAKNFRMYTYIAQELPQLLSENFPIDLKRQSIFGHSMGGHGALTIALQNPQKYKSVSALAPICSPSTSQWGKNAFLSYLGTNEERWLRYDACRLIEARKAQDPILPMLIDQGTKDEFYLEGRLETEKLEDACKKNSYPASIRYQEGYDHSYYFVGSFIEEHIKFHLKYL